MRIFAAPMLWIFAVALAVVTPVRAGATQTSTSLARRDSFASPMLWIFAVAALVTPARAGATQTSTSLCDQDGFQQIWADDFDGTTLDTTKWTITLGKDGGQLRDAWGTANNVYLDGKGALVLRSQREKHGTFNFTSGAVTSKGKASWRGLTPTRVCVRAKLPGGAAATTPGAGDGVWPAHWMMPDGPKSCWPDLGEVDIMEMINGDGVSHGTYHWSRDYPAKNCTAADTGITAQRPVGADWATTYHEYAAEYGPGDGGYVAFFVDGHMINNVTKQSSIKGFHAEIFPEVPRYMILNTAIGGPWPKPVTPKTVFPTYHHIDSVHVAKPATTLTRPSPPSSSSSCTHTVSGTTYDLSPFRGRVLTGSATGSGGRDGGFFNASVCGDLPTRCRDELTGGLQPPGAVFTMFDREPAGTCWDVIARYKHFVGARPLPEGAAGPKGLVLAFKRVGDAHISCDFVTVEVAIRCDARAARTTLSGRQDGCDWRLNVTTPSIAVCGGGR